MGTMTPYIQIRFSATDRSEELQASLGDFAPLGFLDEDGSWCCYFDGDAWPSVQPEIDALITERYPESPYAIEPVPQQNWNAAWEATIQPIRVSDRFIVAPSWHPVEPESGMIVLTIDPKMSFGTGYHETTRLMLRLLDASEPAGTRVLDVGTGTGVLAIAARLLGAREALGVDIDEWSFDNAEENRLRNGITSGLEFRLGTVDAEDGMFDIILSNITRNDNISLLPVFRAMTEPGARLLLSGFYSDDLHDMLDAAGRNGFEYVHSLSEAEWAAALFRRIQD